MQKLLKLTDIPTVVLVSYRFGLIVITERLHKLEPGYYNDASFSSKNRAHDAAPLY